MAFSAKVREDAQLPQLAVATDPVAMREIFQTHLPGFSEGRFILEKLEIRDMDYKPGRKCNVSYGLYVSEKHNRKPGYQILVGMLEPNGGAAHKFAKMQNGSLHAPEFVPPLHFLPEHDMLLWGFPNDPKIKKLAAVTVPERLLALLEEHREALDLPREFVLREVQTSVVKYAPQTRCTLRHVLQLETKSGLGRSQVVLYSKMFSPKILVKPLFRKLQTLWQSPVCRSGALLIPEPLLCDAPLNVIFQRGLHGRNLDEVLPEIELVALAGESGAMLAQFHQTSFERLESRAPEHELYECEKNLARLEQSAPGNLAHAHALDAALRQSFAQLPVINPVPIHGAFRLTQLLLVDGRLALLDFDDLVRGNPVSDVGGFVAYLLYLPLKGLISEAQSQAAVRNFCRKYREQSPWGLPQAALRWYTAAYLLAREVKKCLEKSSKVSKRDYEGMIAKLLARAEEILSGRVELE